jgi:MFS family permease
MLLHQTDKLMIGSLQVSISETFGLNDLQWGLVNSGALASATILYPLWGYLYDRYARAKLLALASFIWGAKCNCPHIHRISNYARLHRHR